MIMVSSFIYSFRLTSPILTQLTCILAPLLCHHDTDPYYGRPIGHVYTVCSCGFFLSFYFFFPRLFSAVTDWMSAILPHMMWPLYKFRMQV